MKSSKLKGMEAEKNVQKTLWRFNYKVRSIPCGDYDLIVDEKFRVEVKCGKLTESGSWKFHFGSKTPVDGLSDIHAMVFSYPDDTYKIAYIKTCDLAKIMKENGSKWNVTIKRINDTGLEKSPYKVFGYPQVTV